MKVLVHSFIPTSKVNGPGLRFVIWLQGCSIRCPGCFNKDTWRFDGGKAINIEDIMDLIKTTKNKNILDGVSISGGEPFDQIDGLLALTNALKEARENILCYTGYHYEHLIKRSDKKINQIIGNINILIDGPFKKKQHQHLKWRGSTNQNILILNRGIYTEPKYISEIEYHFGDSGDTIVTGFPDETMV